MRASSGQDGPSVVLVAVDGSRTSLHAVSYAGGLARRQGARLVALWVQAPSTFAALAPEVAFEIDESTGAADGLRSQLESRAQVDGYELEFLCLQGDPFAQLCKVADELQVDLVVVGASKKLGHRLVGSFAVRLVRAGRWPVTVVP